MAEKLSPNTPAKTMGFVEVSEHFPQRLRDSLTIAANIDPHTPYGFSAARAAALDTALKAARAEFPRLFQREV